MKLYLFACFVIVHMFITKGKNASQLGVYSGIPLCCSKTKVFNGSICVPRGEILPGTLPPLEYEKPKHKHSPEVLHYPLIGCNSKEEMLSRMNFDGGWRIGVMSNGSLTLKIDGQNSTLSSTPEFCLLRFPSEKFSVIFCKRRDNTPIGLLQKLPASQNYIDCSRNLCVSKCCPPGSHFSLTKAFGCVPTSNTTPNFDIKFKSPNGSAVAVTKNVSYIVQFLLCKLYEFDNLNLLANGTLFLPTTGEIIGKDQYCLDIFEKTNSVSLGGSVCSQTLTLSFTERIRRMINPFGFLISCIFLAVTFICHVIIPKLRDMQGLCFMSYVAALFLAFLLLCINLLLPASFSKYGCVGLAILNQYFLMASFFWLNVMCFDIWTIIKGTVHVMPLKGIHSNEKRTFIIYSIYAWGLPFVVSIATFVFHLIPEDSVPDYVIKPQFRKAKCWFPNDIKVLFAYYYGIVAFLLFVNIGFIVHTSIMLFKAGVAFTCCRIRKAIGESDDLKGNKRLLLHMFWHRFCLFALMAVNWTTEVLSFIPPEEMWILTDILNTLQGLLIFILFMRSTNKRLMLAEAWKKIVIQTRRKKKPWRTQTPISNTEMSTHFLADEAGKDRVNFMRSNLHGKKDGKLGYSTYSL